MTDSRLQAITMAFGIGFSLIAFGVTSKRGWGRTRPFYMKTANPLVAPVDGVYGAFPIGIGFVLVGIGLVLDNVTMMGIGLFGGVIVGYVFIFWKPRWLKPDWLLWLEDHYSSSTIGHVFELVQRDKSQYKWVQKCSREQFETWVQDLVGK